MSRRPNNGAYALADMSKRCANCGAEPHTYCRHTDGTDRRIPCISRTPKQPDPYTPECTYDLEHGA